MAIIKGPVNPVISGTTTFPDLKSVQVTAPNRHSVRPSLVLDFANSKTLDPRITFTRGSSATYYDGSTALAEQNLIIQSSSFTSGWTIYNGMGVTVNTTTAPDGTTTAATLTNSSTSKQSFYQVVGGGNVVGVTYTMSVYAKAGTNSWIAFDHPNTGALCAWFNISSGSVGTTTGIVSAAISSVGSGWYRCSITYVASAASPCNPAFMLASGDNSQTQTNGNTAYIWGAQLEVRSVVSAYTPTTSNQISNYIPVLKTAGANQPRFDVDPITKESKGLLIEEQRTNLATNSIAFTTTYLNTTLTTAVAPDGSQTARRYAADTTNAYHFAAAGSVAGVIGTTYTSSFYAKADGDSSVYYEFSPGFTGDIWRSATWNLSTGVVVANNTSGGATITSVGNGWYRCTITQTAGGTGNHAMLVYPLGGSNAAGQGYNGMYIWGFQMEVGSYASSLILANGATVTRSADSPYMTGTNFSSWYNYNEGSLFAEVAHYSNSSTDKRILEIAQAAADSRQYDWRTNSTAVSCLQLGGAGDATSTGVTSMTYFKTAISAAVGTNLFNSVTNGVVGTPATITRMYTPDTMFIGSHAGTGYYTNGWIKKITFYPKRLSTTELQSLTAS